jgi:hypothetical protein
MLAGSFAPAAAKPGPSAAEVVTKLHVVLHAVLNGAIIARAGVLGDNINDAATAQAILAFSAHVGRKAHQVRLSPRRVMHMELVVHHLNIQSSEFATSDG